jgi:hypothetical protein
MEIQIQENEAKARKNNKGRQMMIGQVKGMKRNMEKGREDDKGT